MLMDDQDTIRLSSGEIQNETPVNPSQEAEVLRRLLGSLEKCLAPAAGDREGHHEPRRPSHDGPGAKVGTKAGKSHLRPSLLVA